MARTSAREKYSDIIDMPRHVSKTHPQMAVSDRAAQFSPFAALTGHEAALRETARITEVKVDLDNEEKMVLSDKLCQLRDKGYPSKFVRIVYFKPDQKKSGGAYLTVIGTVKRIDDTFGNIFMADNTVIPIDSVLSVEGDIFDEYII